MNSHRWEVGGGRACADLCQILANHGHEIQVLTSRIKGLPRQEKLDGYKVKRVFSYRRSLYRASFISMFTFIVCAFCPGIFILRRWKPDIIHVHFAVPTGALAWLLSMITRVPYVLTTHLGDVPGGVPEKTDRWFRLVYPLTHEIWAKAKAVVAVSEYTRTLALKHYDVPIRVIHNGVKLTENEQNLIELKVHTPTRIIFAGRLQPQKNLFLLIQALSQMKELSWECTIVGDGPERAALNNKIRSQGIAGRVHMTGWIHPDKVWQKLGESDILTMPSLSEGLPVVGVYALAQGLAMVANRAGGLSDLVKDRVNGRLCAIEDENCFIDALREILQNPTMLLEMKKESLAMSRNYDIEGIAEDYEQLFIELLASK